MRTRAGTPFAKGCLEKDPEERLRISATRYPWWKTRKPASIPPRHGGISGALDRHGRMTIALATLAFIHFRETPAQRQTVRYTMAVPEGTVHSFAISPDGRYVAMAALVNGRRQL